MDNNYHHSQQENVVQGHYHHFHHHHHHNHHHNHNDEPYKMNHNINNSNNSNNKNTNDYSYSSYTSTLKTKPKWTFKLLKYICSGLLLICFALLVPLKLTHRYYNDSDQSSSLSSSSSLVDTDENSPTVLLLKNPHQKATIPKKKDTIQKQNVTVTVWMMFSGWQDWGLSFLQNELLERFGDYHYQTQWVDREKQQPLPLHNLHAPCLIGANPILLEEYRTKNIAPHCYTVVINDEYCKFTTNGDVRFYYQDGMPLMEEIISNKEEKNDAWISLTANSRSRSIATTTKPSYPNSTVYLPLGPRFDFYDVWKKYNNKNNKNNNNNSMTVSSTTSTSTTVTSPSQAVLQQKKTSDRPLIFNAIFSKSTSPSRKLLKEYLTTNPRYANATTTTTTTSSSSGSGSSSNDTTTTTASSSSFSSQQQQYHIQIAAMWRRNMNPERHAMPEQYFDILQNSKFTLSPDGHNPECFRIYEAIEAGSIPIMVINNNKNNKNGTLNNNNDNEEKLLMGFENNNDNNNNNQKKKGGKKKKQKNKNGDKQQQQQQCTNPMRPLFWNDDAGGIPPPPFVILQHWNELEDTIDELLRQDPAILNQRQEELQIWYHNFMRRRVLQLEALLARKRDG